ncbi:MAG TPA: phosphate acetyltransferase [Planctomycetota bacterium]|jgi:phosphate acetyltransferase
MDLIALFKERSRAAGTRVILPEGNDERIVAAARIIAAEGWAKPILVDAVAPASVPAGVLHFSTADAARMAHYTEVYRRASPDLPEKVAQRVVKKALVFGGCAVAAGDADCMVAGAANTTASVISAASIAIGLTPGIKSPSSFFLMAFPDLMGQGPQVLVYADCAVNIQPTVEQLADIAITTANSAKVLLGVDPKIAMLSFSTKGSGQHADADKVIAALKIVRERRPDLAIDGELQADSAIVPRVAAKKCPESPVAGKANVLIFPDLDAGNIGYKLSQYLGKARAYGPILQGFKRPCSDLSRGATAEDIVGTAAIVAAAASGSEPRP